MTLSPLAVFVSDPALGGYRPLTLRRRVATVRRHASGGDGASRPLTPGGPRIVLPTVGPHPARSRSEVQQEEARAALLIPLNRPATYRIS